MDIINLPGWTVTGVQETNQNYIIHADFESHGPCCPSCGSQLLDRHGKIERHYADTPIHGRRVTISVLRQRYKCQSCRKTFFQSIPGVIDQHRMTDRLSAYIRQLAFRRTFVALADDVGLNEKTIRNVFREYIRDLDSQHRVNLPQCLGIDEIKLDGKYRCVLSDVLNRSMVDMLRNRDKITLSNYLFRLNGREHVQIVSMDMWNPYKQIVRELLPGAKIVVDKFHFVRMASDALNRLRKTISSELSAAQRRQLMHDRFLLLKHNGDLNAGQRLILDTWLVNFPILAQAYALKEELHNIFNLRDRPDAERRYAEWKNAMSDDLRSAFAIMLVAEQNWHDEIFAYFDCQITNAYTESLNGLTKLTNRIGRGYSFEVIRAKMLYEPIASQTHEISDGIEFYPHTRFYSANAQHRPISTLISLFDFEPEIPNSTHKSD